MKQMRVFSTLAVLMVAAGMAAADTQWSQVSWFTAQTVAHSISYAVYNETDACSQTALYYVEPSPINGVQTKINASTDSTGALKCQNISQGAIVVTNTGSVGINVSAEFNQITTGVTMKIAINDTGWQASCAGVCNKTECNLNATCLALSTSPVWIRYDLAQNASQEYWLWADFNGVAGTTSPTKGNMTTTAVKYGA